MPTEISKENQRTRGDAYHFADWELNPGERSLTRSGEPVAVAPKTFDALFHFVRNAGHLVSKSELMDALWPSTFVTEANLTNIVVSLRRILGQDAIRTVSKHGYRFALKVEGMPGVSRTLYERFARANELTAERSLESMIRARELYWLCIAEDPMFAPAWAWLGRCSWFLAKFSKDYASAVELADASFRRAFLIDPDLAAAHQFYTPVQTDLGDARRALIRLLTRLERCPAEPESFAGLVQVLRFCGLLGESLAAHRRVADLDPTIVTSVPHTLFLAGDYAGTIDSYGGRTGYYLDAAAWAALGDKTRAEMLLRERLARMPLSPLIRGLMESLALVLEGKPDEAYGCMTSMNVTHEPEVLIYLSRHYCHLGRPESAIEALRRAMQSGFVCSPSTMQSDPWLEALHTHPEFHELLVDAESQTKEARSIMHRHRITMPTV